MDSNHQFPASQTGALYVELQPQLAETERFERSQDFSRHLSGVLPYQLGDVSELVQCPKSKVFSQSMTLDLELETL